MTTPMIKQKRKNEDRQPLLIALLGEFLRGIGWAFRYTGRAIGWSVRSVWRGLRWSLRGAWRGTKWALRGTGYGLGWLLLQPWRLLSFLINGRVPEFQNAQQEEAFWRVKRQFRRRRFYLTHVFVFIMGMGIIWFDFLSPGSEYVPFQNYAVGSLIWGLLLAFHFVRVRVGEAEDEALSHVMQLGTETALPPQKQKNSAGRWAAAEHRLRDEYARDDDFQEEEDGQYIQRRR